MGVPRDDEVLSGPPPPATRKALEAALEKQTTSELIKRARQYAQARATLVRRAGGSVSKTYARDLVDDAHADTWSGDLPWDPSQCSLMEHLCQAIKHRTWLEIRHVRRVPLVSLHAPTNDGTTAQQIERALAHAAQGDCSPVLLHAVSATVCQELRRLVPEESEAAVLLQCWETGLISRDGVMERTGLTKRAYDRARKRLLYLSRYLTPALHESALDLLRSAS
jgi:hypothetical protein